MDMLEDEEGAGSGEGEQRGGLEREKRGEKRGGVRTRKSERNWEERRERRKIGAGEGVRIV